MIPQAKEFLQLINDNFPYFTIKIISVVEFRRLMMIKKDSKATSGLKGDAVTFLKDKGPSAPIFHIKLNWDEYPGFVNLLTSTTIARFTLSSGDVSATNELTKVLIPYLLEEDNPHITALFQVR